MYDLNKLKELVLQRDVHKLKEFMKENNLIIKDNRIIPQNTEEYKTSISGYDLKQYVEKIKSNSLYGVLLQSSSVFYDFRLGASTTFSGRRIWKHLSSKANEIMTGEYKSNGGCLVGGDTDSQKYDSIQYVRENGVEKQITIEELFNKCTSYHIDERTGKEYGFTKIEVLGYNKDNDRPQYYPINYVYRHKTSKPMWEIEDENGNIVTVTNDHSCMVERNNELIVVKPYEILENDILITIDNK